MPLFSTMSSYRPFPAGITAHCWHRLPSDCQRLTAVPRACPQLTASKTLFAFTFVIVHLLAPTLLKRHCWQLLPSDCHWSIFVPLAVPQLTASRTFPLLRLVIR